jgi:RNA polymerase sigma factor (sigma-70 family)
VIGQSGDMDERAAVQASRCGDQAAFGCLIDLHYRDLYRFAYWSTGSHGDADDICQETFLTALDKIRSLRQDACFKAWLYKIALNLVRKRSRIAKPASEQAEATDSAPQELPDEGDAGAVEVLNSRERAALVHDELGRLPEPLRMAAALVLMDGVPQKQAAGILGCSEATLSRRLEMVRDILRVRLRHALD